MPTDLMAASTHLDWIDPVQAFRSFASDPMSLLLYGGGQGPQARYTILAVHPSRVWIEADPARARIQMDEALSEADGGYLAGLFGYELGAAFEPGLSAVMPDGNLALALGLYPAIAVFDHVERTIMIRGEDKASRILEDRLSDKSSSPPPSHDSLAPLDPVWSEQDYLDAARRARDYVRAGDVFQVNLSHRFEGRIAGHPASVFERLTQQSPAGYAAFLNIDEDRVVVTNSPEQFLYLDDAGNVSSRPIKGTVPRGANDHEDAQLKDRLGRSVKDHAENLMIVDLMRNDLSRVCQPGSVSVPERSAIETYANVHHLVSTVSGRMAADRTMMNLVAATFPPGSITGAPKIRAMEIIAELEGEARNAYCGAMGWINTGEGGLHLNVMIRTLTFHKAGAGWTVTARSGGAITADSDPASELAETHAKIAALKRALEG